MPLLILFLWLYWVECVLESFNKLLLKFFHFFCQNPLYNVSKIATLQLQICKPPGVIPIYFNKCWLKRSHSFTVPDTLRINLSCWDRKAPHKNQNIKNISKLSCFIFLQYCTQMLIHYLPYWKPLQASLHFFFTTIQNTSKLFFFLLFLSVITKSTFLLWNGDIRICGWFSQILMLETLLKLNSVLKKSFSFNTWSTGWMIYEIAKL